MSNFPILSVVTFLPIIGGLFILLFIKDGRANSKNNLFWTALFFSVVVFILSLMLLFDFNKTASGFQFVECVPFIKKYDIKYYLGIDGISLLMILLTTLLVPICLVSSLNSIKIRIKEYVIAFLFLESFVIGSFVANDLVLFYIFFEAMLIPMFLIIGIWGGKNRIYSAYKFFLYTLFGSLFFLVAIIYICYNFGTADINLLRDELPILGSTIQKLLWLAFFISFAVKIPMFPFHTWLPDAHVEAPTAGSVILAGILIKLGAYGFIRFSLPFFPFASHYFTPLVFVLSVTAIIYASLIALVQKDIKKMIAYSSVAHMGFVTMGIFAFNVQGMEGAVFQMISHGLVSSALFLCVGVVYDRTHSRQIEDFGGLVNKMPNYAFFTMIFTMAAVGLPGTSGFIGEFLAIVGAFKANKVIAFIAAFGIVLGATYMLWLYSRVIFGEVINSKLNIISDLNKTELLILSVIAILVLLIGIYPGLILQFINVPVADIVGVA